MQGQSQRGGLRGGRRGFGGNTPGGGFGGDGGGRSSSNMPGRYPGEKPGEYRRRMANEKRNAAVAAEQARQHRRNCRIKPRLHLFSLSKALFNTKASTRIRFISRSTAARPSEPAQRKPRHPCQ